MLGRRRAAALLAALVAAALAASCTSQSSGEAASRAADSSTADSTATELSPTNSPADSPATSPGSPRSPSAASKSGPPSPTSATRASPSASPSPSRAASPSSSPSARPAKPSPAPTTPKPGPAKPPLLVEQLANVGDATQVVIVTSASWGADTATLQTFERDANGWRAVFPAMAAHIGRAGFSADKHEGDLKTPTGKYSFGTMFGQRSNPGVKFPYRQADSQSVWVDDVRSPYYNTWQENAALSGEHLAAAGFATAYAYAVAINYNTAPIVPGKGSAIFLHVSTGGGTAGCVSVAQKNLLDIMRWLDPAKRPVIVMGPSSVIRSY